MSRKISGSVEFRGTPGRWHARVTVYDEQGVAHRPWVDLERPDLKNTPEGKLAAKRLAAQRAKKAIKGKYVGKERAAAPSVIVSDLQEKWFALLDVDTHLGDGTRSTYKSCFRSNIMDAFGNRRVSELTVDVLRVWIRELTAERSASTVCNNAIALTRFLGDARAEKWATLESNPMKHEDVRAMLPSVEAPEPEDIVQWTREQYETLLALPSLPDDRFGLYLIAVLTGLRAGELRGLTFGHIGTVDGVSCVMVRQQLRLAREGGTTTTIGKPKTKSSKRNVPLHPAALAWLTWWRAEGWEARFNRERTEADPVFPAVDGKAGRPRDANILRRDLETAKLPLNFITPDDGVRIPFTFHATRRTFARLLADAGAPTDAIEMLAGHAGKTVTERHYMGRSLEAMARAIALIKLALPLRAGLKESSFESSLPVPASNVVTLKPAGKPSESQLQPIELPQLRHSSGMNGARVRETSKNQPDHRRHAADGTLPERAISGLMEPARITHGTIEDDSVTRALAKALEHAKDDKVIAAIVAELAARRGRS